MGANPFDDHISPMIWPLPSHPIYCCWIDDCTAILFLLIPHPIPSSLLGSLVEEAPTHFALSLASLHPRFAAREPISSSRRWCAAHWNNGRRPTMTQLQQWTGNRGYLTAHKVQFGELNPFGEVKHVAHTMDWYWTWWSHKAEVCVSISAVPQKWTVMPCFCH